MEHANFLMVTKKSVTKKANAQTNVLMEKAMILLTKTQQGNAKLAHYRRQVQMTKASVLYVRILNASKMENVCHFQMGNVERKRMENAKPFQMFNKSAAKNQEKKVNVQPNVQLGKAMMLLTKTQQENARFVINHKDNLGLTLMMGHAKYVRELWYQIHQEICVSVLLMKLS